MRSFTVLALGLGFILMATGLFALTLRKPKAASAVPSKAQLREQAALAKETKKMHIAAGIVAGFGVLLCVISFL